MERRPGQRDTTIPLVRREIGIVRNSRGFAYFGNEIGCIEGAIAIDQKARQTGFHKRRVEQFGHALGHGQGARIPCNVT